MVGRSQRPARLLLVLVLGVGACDQATTRRTNGQQEELATLGYVLHAEERPDPSRMGVVTASSGHMQPGHTLITLPRSCSAQLLSATGEVEHAWSHEGCVWWAAATWLDGGDLLVIAIQKSPQLPPPPIATRRVAMRMDWSGRVEWQRRLPAHHRGVSSSRGDLIALTRAPANDRVTTLSAAGQVLRHLDIRTGATSVDVLSEHTPKTRQTLFRRDDLVVAHPAAVTVLDPKTGQARWSRTGAPVLEANVLDNLHLLLVEEKRVVELDAVRGEIVWSWAGTAPSSAQRLANGNTLITEGSRGRVVEVQRHGEVVWEYWLPRVDHNGRRPTLAYARRVAGR